MLAYAISISYPQMQLLLQNLHDVMSLDFKFNFNSCDVILCILRSPVCSTLNFSRHEHKRKQAEPEPMTDKPREALSKERVPNRQR